MRRSAWLDGVSEEEGKWPQIKLEKQAGRAQTVPSIEKLLIKIEGLGRRLGKVQRKKSCPVLCPGFDSGK